MRRIWKAQQVRSKTCRQCKRDRPVEQFYKSSSAKDGYQSWCADCHLAAQRARATKYRLRQGANERGTGTKLCPTCQRDRAKSNFYLCAKTKDGLQFQCKDCDRVTRAETYRRSQRRKLNGNREDRDAAG